MIFSLRLKNKKAIFHFECINLLGYNIKKRKKTLRRVFIFIVLLKKAFIVVQVSVQFLSKTKSMKV